MQQHRVVAMVLAVAVSLVACGSGGSDAADHRSASASDDVLAFYAPPDPLPAGALGDVIRAEPVRDVDGGRMLRVMYHSRSVTGADIAVTGIIATPSATPPEGGFPVLSWAHGTSNVADACAPSVSPDGIGNLAGMAKGAIAAGYVLVATDYEGIGTPGRHPYLVGVSEARSAIDIVRAARSLADVHAGDRYAVVGYSQGGHTALYALAIAAAWAPDLELVGAVAGAPPADLPLLDATLRAGPLKALPLEIAAGFNAAYGDDAAPLLSSLTADGRSLIDSLETECGGGFNVAAATADIGALEHVDPLTTPAWAPLVAANDPMQIGAAGSAPLLIVHGDADEIIPADTSSRLLDHLCTLGQATERWVYPSESHAGVIAASAADVVTWLDERFAGTAVADGSKPKGAPAGGTQRC